MSDSKVSQDELATRLSDAAKSAVVGKVYRHYKGGLYEVVNLAIQESDGEVVVIYAAEYRPELYFSRLLSSWLEMVEVDGQARQRFTSVASR